MDNYYSYVITPEAEDTKYEYGVMKGYGARNVIFMKLPQGSSIHGKRNEYAKQAKKLFYRRYDTVVVSSLFDADASTRYDLETIKKLSKSDGGFERGVTLIGFGSGGRHLLENICPKISFDRAILINSPLPHLLGDVMELFSGVDRRKVKFVYSTDNVYGRYAPLLRRMYLDVRMTDISEKDLPGNCSYELYSMTYCK